MTGAYAQWGRVQMADAEAEAAARPEVPRVVPALRARLWQLQTELREQEVSEASSRAYCRGFCQVGGGRGGPRRGRQAGCAQGDAAGQAPLCPRSAGAGGAQGSALRARLSSGAVLALPRAPRGLCAASPEQGGLLGFGLWHRCGAGLGWVSGARAVLARFRDLRLSVSLVSGSNVRIRLV